VYPEVLAAMARPTIGHLDPAFVGFMDELNERLRYTFQTRNTVTLPISAPGSAGMECCFVNLLEPGDKVVIASNGVFGGRMLENANRCGADPVYVEFEWGTPVDPGKVEDAHWPSFIPRHRPASVRMRKRCATWQASTGASAS
jgi:alanine-glyoxylate transaminase/serine-glyoxylate transaminase/serine-pyruvate transaminase